MSKQLWWQKPLRVIQTNLQIADTPLMVPQKLAGEMEAMGANTLVINVGGIYAWYPSEIPFHHINEYLPSEGDLLGEMIAACHARSIRVVARFDFSKTDDFVFQKRPWWFVKDEHGKPRIYGKERPGNWSLLYTTCLNGGYRGREFAVPVIQEVLRKYDIDGIFFNAPHYEFCTCQTCKEKYLAKYGKPIPEQAEALEDGWAIDCVRECVGTIYQTVKEENPNTPLILYYSAMARENLYDRLAMADMLCTEAQDILSRGWQHIPPAWEGAMAMKAGRTVNMAAQPFGIIHSCPGMDWRHAGLPPAEYRYWLAQIPANGGSIWHSITGFPDTISDKRLLRAVTEVNHAIAICEEDMVGATSAAQVALLWDGTPAACGYFDALTATHVQFDLVDKYVLTLEKLAAYKAVVLPEGFPLCSEVVAVLEQFVRQGGVLLAEGAKQEQLAALMPLLGVDKVLETSEPMVAAYVRMIGDSPLNAGLEESPLLPLRGQVAYVRVQPEAEVLATLVPPFAPLDAVGAPPERASILCPYTDIPMAVFQRYGEGRVLYLPFQLSMLIGEYKLADHYRLVQNAVDMLLDGQSVFSMPQINGLQAVLYQKGSSYLLHLVNGVGQRPLATTTPLSNIRFSLRTGKSSPKPVATSLIGKNEVTLAVEDGVIHGTLQRLDVWDVLRIDVD